MSTARAEGCDGAFWQLIHTVSEQCVKSEVATTIYNFEKKKIKPSEDHGFYKYDVLMVQDDPNIKEAEVLRAYIGDVDWFINNQAKAGRVGVLVKTGSIPNRSVKKIFTLILNNMEFPQKKIKSILTEVK